MDLDLAGKGTATVFYRGAWIQSRKPNKLAEASLLDKVLGTGCCEYLRPNREGIRVCIYIPFLNVNVVQQIIRLEASGFNNALQGRKKIPVNGGWPRRIKGYLFRPCREW
jgi:hypothetical protein